MQKELEKQAREREKQKEAAEKKRLAEQKKANDAEEKRKANSLTFAMKVLGKLSPLHSQLVVNLKDKKADHVPSFVLLPAQQVEDELNKVRHCLTV